MTDMEFSAAACAMRVRDAQTGGHGWAGAHELQGVTVDFWGAAPPQLHLWPQAARLPLARMYREQLGRRARSVGTVGLLPGLNTLSFETEKGGLASMKQVRLSFSLVR